MTSNNPDLVQVAVVGAGYWGPNIIRNFETNPHCELVAVCDQDTDKLASYKKRFGHSKTLTTDFDALLQDPAIDAVAIVTDIGSHFKLASAALKAGKHVFVEKPLATTVQECIDLGALAKTHQRTLMVGHTFIYNPAVRMLKSIMDSGQLGDIYYLHGQRLNLGRIQMQVNVLWSLCIHDVAIALYLYDELPYQVQAWGSAFLTPGIEDVTFVNLTFPSGKMAHLHTSWLDPEKQRQVTVVGSKQMVVYDDVSLDRKITIYDKGIEHAPSHVPHPEYKDFSGFQLLTRSGDVTIPKLNFTEPLTIEIQHFLDCVTGKESQPITDWQAGLAVVHILQAAEQSLKNNGVLMPITWPDSVQTKGTTHGASGR